MRKTIIAHGVKNLRDYGYPDCDEKNILTDPIYSVFFKSMLQDNIGKSTVSVDRIINDLIAEIDKKGGAT